MTARTRPGTFGEINVTLISRTPKGVDPDSWRKGTNSVDADVVDLFRSVKAPPAVLEWARSNPAEVIKLVNAAKRRNRTVRDSYQAEAWFRRLDTAQMKRLRARGNSAAAATQALQLRFQELGVTPEGSGLSRLNALSSMTDLVDDYLKFVLDAPGDERRTQTRMGKKKVIERVIRPRLGNFKIGEVKGPQIAELRLALLNEKKTHDAKEAFILLREIFALAVRHGAIPGNPMADSQKIPRKSKRAVQRDVVFMTTEQVTAARLDLLQWELDRVGQPGPKPDRQYRQLFETLIGTATRINEALGLRKCDIFVDDAGRLLVHVCGTIVHDDNEKLVRQDQPKAGGKVVAVPVATQNALLERLAVIADKPDDYLVFSTRKGTPHDDGNIRRAFTRVSTELAKVSPEGFSFHPHLTRSSAATHVASTLGREAAAKLLAHGDLSSIHHYVPADLPVPDYDAAAVLDELLPVLPALPERP